MRASTRTHTYTWMYMYMDFAISLEEQWEGSSQITHCIYLGETERFAGMEVKTEQ